MSHSVLNSDSEAASRYYHTLFHFQQSKLIHNEKYNLYFRILRHYYTAQ